MEIKVKYWSNHGKAHYINFESFDDYIAKYKEDPKFGTFFASGIEAKFGNCDKYTNFKTFKNLFNYCCDAKIQRKNKMIYGIKLKFKYKMDGLFLLLMNGVLLLNK